MTDLIIYPPTGRKAPCAHGTWFNSNPDTEGMPTMMFKCAATGFVGDPAKKKNEGMCNKCILFQEKR